MQGKEDKLKQQAAFQAQSIAASSKKAGFQRTSQILEAQQKQLALAQEKGKVTKAAREQLASASCISRRSRCVRSFSASFNG